MAKLAVRTRDGKASSKKRNVYIACHPEDFEKYFEPVCKEILEMRDCAIYYDAEPEVPWTSEEMERELGSMRSFLFLVSHRFFDEENKARSQEFGFALKNEYKYLMVMKMEAGTGPRLKELYGERKIWEMARFVGEKEWTVRRQTGELSRELFYAFGEEMYDDDDEYDEEEDYEEGDYEESDGEAGINEGENGEDGISEEENDVNGTGEGGSIRNGRCESGSNEDGTCVGGGDTDGVCEGDTKKTDEKSMNEKNRRSKLACKTTYGNRPRGINKVYFISSPEDREKYYDTVCAPAFGYRNCEIYYDAIPETPWTQETLESELADMRGGFLVVTRRFLEKEGVEPSPELEFFRKNGIDVMAALVEDGVEEDFIKLCPGIPYLDKYKWDQEPEDNGYNSSLKMFCLKRLEDVEGASLYEFSHSIYLANFGCKNCEDVIMAVAADALRNVRRLKINVFEDAICVCMELDQEETIRAVALPLKYSYRERRDRLDRVRGKMSEKETDMPVNSIVPDEQRYDRILYGLRTAGIGTVGDLLNKTLEALEKAIAGERTLSDMDEIRMLYLSEKFLLPN